MRLTSFILVLLIGTVARSQAVFAQVNATTSINEWERQTGVYVTKAVRAQFPKYQAEQFDRAAATTGFQRADQIAGALRSSKVKIYSHGHIADSAVGHAVLEDESGHPNQLQLTGDQRRALFEVFGTDFVASFVEKFATIRLDVVPVPPRDYRVVINGESCPATLKGLYKVPPGSTEVNVTRVKKPPCNWNGDISAGKQQLVSCKL
jgi:hypothetical protein